MIKNYVFLLFLFLSFFQNTSSLFALAQNKSENSALERLSIQAAAVQHEYFAKRFQLGFDPWKGQESATSNLKFTLGAGILTQSACEKISGGCYEFIFGLQNRIFLTDGLAFATTGQVVSREQNRFLEALFALSIGEARGLNLDLGVGLRRLWEGSREGVEEEVYDQWRLFPALALSYQFH